MKIYGPFPFHVIMKLLCSQALLAGNKAITSMLTLVENSSTHMSLAWCHGGGVGSKFIGRIINAIEDRLN